MASMFVTKSMFFDRVKILNKAHEAEVRNLNRIGGTVKVTEQRLMRYATGKRAVSKPGESPVSHKPLALLRQKTYFGYDKAKHSVVIGPEKLNVSKTAGDTVPHVLEFGGDVIVEEVQLSGGLWRRKDLVPIAERIGRPVRMRKAHIEPRPYAEPALQKNLPKLAGVWAGTIRE